MTLDLTTLSSNWKKLQNTLKGDKKQEHGSSARAVAVSTQQKPLKRKAQDSTYKDNTATSYKRKRFSETQSKAAGYSRKMGAYVSSLSAASDEAQKSLNTENHAQDVEAPLLAHPAPDQTAAVLQDPTAAGRYIAIDCEMVGTHSLTPFSTPAHNIPPGAPPEYSILARVSLVSYSLVTIYDAYVLPPTGVAISDYRTQYSGITPWHLNPLNTTTLPKPFATIQCEVADLIAGRVLVGHAIKNDLAVLGLGHPRRDIRDTARHPPFRQLAATVGRDGKLGRAKTPSLKKLAAEVLGWGIQGDEKRGHSSVEDAKATMALFRKEKAGFEREHIKTYGRSALVGRGKKSVAVGGTGALRTNQDHGSEDEDEDDEEVDDEGGEEDENGEDNEVERAKPDTKKTKKKGKRKKRTKR